MISLRETKSALLRSKPIKAGAGYTFANFLIHGLALLSLPLFSRIMSVEEMGLYSVWVSYNSITIVVIGFALHASVKSANYEFKGQIYDYLSSVTLLYFIGLVFLAVVLTAFNPWLGSVSGIEYVAWIAMLIVSLSNALSSLYGSAVSLNYSYKDYMKIGLFNSVTTVVASLFLMLTVFSFDRYLGRITGSLIASIFVIAYIVSRFWKKKSPKANLKYWRFGLRYSLPIIPHGISQVLLATADRVMINAINGSQAAGLYGLAGYILSGFNVVVSSMDPVWSTWFYAKMASGEAGVVAAIRLRATMLSLFYACLCAHVIAFSPEIIFILGGEAYAQASNVAPLVSLSGFFLLVYNLVCIGEYYAQKTKFIAVGTMLAAAVNIVLNAIFLPCYGFVAAGATTAISYFLYVVFHMVISNKCLRFAILPPSIFAVEFGLLLAMCLGTLLFIQALALRLGFLLLALASFYLIFTNLQRKE